MKSFFPRSASPSLQSELLSTATVKTAPPEPSLGQRTAQGFAWLVAQTLASKLVTLGGQVALAWYLQPDDFGVVGMAYTVVAFAGLVQQGGQREILIQRQKNFRRWSNVAFWTSIAFAVLASCVMIAAAPLAARIYRTPALMGMLFILAATAPIDALSVVPSARLQIDLRFGTMALFAFAGALATTALSVLFAYRGYGAYSFVLPRPIVGLVQALALWWLTRPPISLAPQVRRWRFMLGDSALIIATWFFYMIFTQGAYMILGILHAAYVVGIYYFAFNLSMQVVAIFMINLWGVLMPALAKLTDQPQRQLEGFLAATRMLAVMGVPVSLLVGAAADPAIRLFFNKKWEPSIHVLEVLSLGMTLMLVGSPGGTLLQARGKFLTMFKLAAGCTVLFLILVTIGAYLGAALSVAVAVACFYGFYGPVNMYVGIRAIGGTWRHVWSVYSLALVPSLLSVGSAYLVARLIPASSSQHWLRLVVISVLSLALYLPLLRLLSPPVWNEVRNRLQSLLPRRLAANQNTAG
jgi:PST family polysaccharide transporter